MQFVSAKNESYPDRLLNFENVVQQTTLSQSNTTQTYFKIQLINLTGTPACEGNQLNYNKPVFC
jgi:hypothetical protein